MYMYIYIYVYTSVGFRVSGPQTPNRPAFVKSLLESSTRSREGH